MKTAALLVAFIFALGFAGTALAGPITVNEAIGSHQGPWLYGVGLNTGFVYGVNDHTPPTLVGAADGFAFLPGETLTVRYLSGLTNAFGGSPEVDANGYPGLPFNDISGSSGRVAPSFYMDHATYPINLNELVGAFADGSGAIVGTPFKIGDGPTDLIIPTGASRLQLGINDDIFGDNTGSLLVEVVGLAPAPPPSGVPEPSTFLLLASGLAGLGGIAWRRRHRG